LKTIVQEEVDKEGAETPPVTSINPPGPTLLPPKTPPKSGMHNNNTRTRNNEQPLSETPGPDDSIILETGPQGKNGQTIDVTTSLHKKSLKHVSPR